MKNILVIFGGKSVEHDISIITAMQVLANLPKGYNFIPIYIDRDQHWWVADNLDKAETFLDFVKNVKHKRACTLVAGASMLYEVKNGKFKKSFFIHGALLCCHGGICEGGALQGLLKLCKIPFTSPDMQSSVVCMDKILTKYMLKANDIKVVDFIHFAYKDFIDNKNYYVEKTEKQLGYPLIVKPAKLGSSVGIHICADRQQFYDALKIAKEYDDNILVEKYLSSCREYACACLQVNDKAFTSSVLEVNKKEIYSFDEKYLHENNKVKKVPKDMEQAIKNLTSKTYSALDCEGLVRIDFLYSKDGELFVCEANTIPGSLSCNLFTGIKFSDLLENLIEEAIQKNNSQDSLIYSYSSDAIKHYIDIRRMNKITKI